MGLSLRSRSMVPSKEFLCEMKIAGELLVIGTSFDRISNVMTSIRAGIVRNPCYFFFYRLCRDHKPSNLFLHFCTSYILRYRLLGSQVSSFTIPYPVSEFLSRFSDVCEPWPGLQESKGIAHVVLVNPPISVRKTCFALPLNLAGPHPPLYRTKVRSP